MPRVIFSITYAVKPQAREEYLETVSALKNYLTLERGKDYSVFEVKGKPNQFSEVYICKSVEEFDALEDDSDDVTDQLINRIVNDFVKDGKTEYKTLIETV
ncbi:MAG: hypothetical protein HY962_06635 [Ignavibacteriae bacterium]|nr:hypothetical protein [Ignavibacteriota bacterium]